MTAAYEPETPPDSHAAQPVDAAANGSGSPAPADPPEEPKPTSAAKGAESVIAPSATSNGTRGASNGSAKHSPEPAIESPAAEASPDRTPPSYVIVTLRRSPDPSFDLDLLKRLDAAASANQGPTPLQLHVVKTDGSIARLRWSKTVQPNDTLLAELSAQFGKDSVAVR